MTLPPQLDINSRLFEISESIIAIDSKFKEYFLDKKIYLISKVTAADICRIMDVSQRELNDYFFTTHGYRVATAIDNYRIDEALEIMQRTPSISISKLSHNVGYGSSVAFLYHFVKYQRCLPSTWRHRNI